MRNLTQALKTKTGAVQTAAVKRIFYLAVRDLPDASLAQLNLRLDYEFRGMHPAYYVSVAEAVIGKMVSTHARNSTISSRTKEAVTMQTAIQSALAKVRRP